jgi:hypothetical protein
VNFPDPFSTIYWTATEASDEFVYGFKLAGLKQGKVEKAADTPVNVFVFLSWPVPDGDVAAEIEKRLSTAVFRSLALMFFRFHRSVSDKAVAAIKIDDGVETPVWTCIPQRQ